jgi:nucleoid-associated protein YgaU
MMAISRTIFVSALVALAAGCATAQKNMTPVSDQQKSEVLKGMDVVEQPALEPDWSDYVKEHYPNWRQHYWVDRGNWGNRGYIMGKPTAENEPVVETQMTPLPPVTQPPAIVESEPPKIEQAEKPTKYVVKKGDSLWKIAGKVYHNPLKWPRIYKANKDKIRNPNRIHPGQVLTIPWE